jgi:hypothetical protein
MVDNARVNVMNFSYLAGAASVLTGCVARGCRAIGCFNFRVTDEEQTHSLTRAAGTAMRLQDAENLFDRKL